MSGEKETETQSRSVSGEKETETQSRSASGGKEAETQMRSVSGETESEKQNSSGGRAAETRAQNRRINLITAAVFLLVLAGIRFFRPYVRIWREAGTFVPGIVTSRYDDHGGFHGDGIAFYRMKVFGGGWEKKVRESADWHALPLQEYLSWLAYGRPGASGVPLSKQYGPKPFFPRVEHGYYYFRDYHRKALTPYDPEDVRGPERASYNFYLVIYDTDQRMLYFCKFDT